jgi:large subunit GTPase 1
MVLNGVLPIDNIKDYLSPIDLLASRISPIVLEKLYGLPPLGPAPNTPDILSTYSLKRGFYTGSGTPD